MHPRLALPAVLLASALILAAEDKPYTPRVQPASDEPQRAMKGFKIPKGMNLDLWAAEPMLANPVIFTIDNKGRVFVAETFRLHAGVTDIRNWLRAGWLDDDLACRTVADRLAMYKQRLGKEYATWNVHHERVRLLEDTKGAGKADKASVFADGFKRVEDGIGAGLLVRGNDVYYTCIPDLWLLRDPRGTGKATSRKSLSTGYGVHTGFIGHDLHGLVMGPDGKLYFSIGDRGLNVKKDNRHLYYPDTGCVLRCNLDGSDLEVFATGLRNPQELAFDQYGNLFTGDNNSDSGDKARWVYLVEGGDSGWRIGYQFDGIQGSRGPWNAEKLWHPRHAGQAAWIIPPITNLGNGPSGLVYYPGTGLAKKYDGHFFLADFRGQARGSRVHAFTNKPSGAGFELTGLHDYVVDMLATDVDFGPDGAMYLSDWVHGWGLTGKGRIWKLTDPKHSQDAATKEAKTLLAGDWAKQTTKKLGELLAHKNMRVRQEAQFTLVARKDGAAELVRQTAPTRPQLARIHALWGLGQIYRTAKNPAWKNIITHLADKDDEIRAQAARMLGEKNAAGADELTKMIKEKDETERVKFFAASSLGKIGKPTSVDALVEMLRHNNDKDAYLRHAGVMGLAGCATDKQLTEAAKDASPAVRRAVLLVYRRKASAEVATFLNDADASLIAEAARAINDVPIESARPKLAALIERTGLDDVVGYRALNANFRLGKAENARAVAALAGRAGVKESLRIEAVKMLGEWSKPSGRDKIMGVWWPLKGRDKSIAIEALRPALGRILTGPDRVRTEAVKVAAALGIKDIGPTLFALVKDLKRPAAVRVETLRALTTLKDKRLPEAIKLALADKEPGLRAAGRHALALTKPADAIKELSSALDKGTTLEKQQAFDTLGAMKGDAARKVLSTALDQLIARKLSAEVRLDLVEAAEKHNDAALNKKLQAYEKARPRNEPFGKWRDSLAGGDAGAGRAIFQNRSEVSCIRCHKAAGLGVGEVGPDLTGIGSKQKPEYLLEAIVDPNKQIAKGFETLELTLVTGKLVTGIVKSETAREVKLMTPEGALITVPTSRIESRRRGKSAMPEDLVKHLSRKDVRDLVAFLVGLKEPPKK